MLQTIIYARKSTESDDRQVLSIDSQVRELKELAGRQGLRVDRVYTESKSAKSPGRLVFGEVMRLVNKNGISTVICWKLDRLARNPVDGGAVIWALEEGRLRQIVTPQQAFDRSSNSKFWMQLEFGMAKKYVDDLADNVRRGLRAKLELGWIPNIPPIGYLNDRNSRTIVPDPERFKLVRKMWQLMLGGNTSPKRILEIATDQWGLRTRRFRRGGGPLAFAAVYKMFRQPFYYGAIRQKGALYPGKHKPMITKSEFDEVQRLLSRGSATRPQRHIFAYTGLIKCGECGASITAEHKRQRHGHRYVYYHCTRRKMGSRCRQRVVEVGALERQLSGFLQSVAVPNVVVGWVKWVLGELRDDEETQKKSETESLAKRISGNVRELNELTNMRIRGLLTDGEFVAKRNELMEERFRLEESAKIAGSGQERASEETLEEFRFAALALKRLAKGSPMQKRAVLQWTGSNPTLMNGILSITPRKPLELIQRTLSSPGVRDLILEPPNRSELQRDNGAPHHAFSKICALVKDVRTCVMKNGQV